jgi:hypothetical protein
MGEASKELEECEKRAKSSRNVRSEQRARGMGEASKELEDRILGIEAH